MVDLFVLLPGLKFFANFGNFSIVERATRLRLGEKYHGYHDSHHTAVMYSDVFLY